MRTFTVIVDYDDPTHRKLLPSERCSVNLERWTELFPIHGKGKAEVEFEYADMTGREPSGQGQLDALAASGLDKPDFAEHRGFHAAYPEERNIGAVISFIGELFVRQVVSNGYKDYVIPWVFAADADEMRSFHLDYRSPLDHTGGLCRVLGVRRRTPIPP